MLSGLLILNDMLLIKIDKKEFPENVRWKIDHININYVDLFIIYQLNTILLYFLSKLQIKNHFKKLNQSGIPHTDCNHNFKWQTNSKMFYRIDAIALIGVFLKFNWC